jgi:hypothetical protein
MLDMLTDQNEMARSEEQVVSDSNETTTTSPSEQMDPLTLLIYELHTTPSIETLMRYGQQVGHELTPLQARAVLGLLTEVGAGLRLIARIVTGLENVTEKAEGTAPRSLWSDAFTYEPVSEGTIGQQIDMARLLFPSQEGDILRHAAKFYDYAPAPVVEVKAAEVQENDLTLRTGMYL